MIPGQVTNVTEGNLSYKGKPHRCWSLYCVSVALGVSSSAARLLRQDLETSETS